MIELEAHVQQQTTLEDAGCDDPRITDGAQQNCVVLTNLVQLVRREQLAGGVVATGTEIVFGGFQIRNQLAEHLERSAVTSTPIPSPGMTASFMESSSQ